jgi:hypothetical protein
MCAMNYDDIRRELLAGTERLYELIDPERTLSRSALIAAAQGRVASHDALHDVLDAVQNCIAALLDTLTTPADHLAAL